MANYRKSSHTVYDKKYYTVWITKYRKPILRADKAQAADGIQVVEQGVLGTTYAGTRVLFGQFARA